MLTVSWKNAHNICTICGDELVACQFPDLKDDEASNSVEDIYV